MAQWKHVGPITRRALDQNYPLLNQLLPFVFTIKRTDIKKKKSKVEMVHITTSFVPILINEVSRMKILALRTQRSEFQTNGTAAVAMDFWYFHGRKRLFHSDKQIWKEKKACPRSFPSFSMQPFHRNSTSLWMDGLMLEQHQRKKIVPVTIWHGGASEAGDMSERKSTDSPVAAGFPAERPPKCTCFGPSPSPLFSGTLCQP